MGLYGLQGIGFRTPLRGLSSFRVIPGLVVPAHPFPVAVQQSFEFYTYFLVGFKNLGLIFLWCHIGWFFVT